MNELVSIIVPIYNTGPYLTPCLESLISQTYHNLEIILVDDGSTDGSSIICDNFARRDQRIKVIHQENAGVSAARNAGLDTMHGAFLLFVDGDDTLSPNTIEVTTNEFLEDSVDVVLFGVTKIWQQENRTEPLPMEVGTFSRKEMLFGILRDYASFGAGFPVNKVWRVRSFGVCSQIPRFDQSLYYFEDMEWVVRMLLRIQTAKLLPHYFYSYYIRSSSVTHRPGVQEHREFGYHNSIKNILKVLPAESAVYHWFSHKYYPEIVNGVIHAHTHNWIELKKFLSNEMRCYYNTIINSNSIPVKIKFRCFVLHILQTLHLL